MKRSSIQVAVFATACMETFGVYAASLTECTTITDDVARLDFPIVSKIPGLCSVLQWLWRKPDRL
jgi:hypothetical protein